MKSRATGRHAEIIPEIRQVISQKLAKLERLLNYNAVSVQVVLMKEHHQCCAEVVLHARGDHMLPGESEGAAWSQAVGNAAEKINQQAHSLKGKWDKHRRNDTL